jgi:adenylate cyclase
MSSDNFQRKLTAILSADVVGYSRLMGENEAATVKTLETYKGVMFSLIKQHRGRVVDSPGDNVLAEFGSVVDAVQCAVSIQKELQTRNADLSENRRMEFRIGINLGDVIEEGDRIYGDGVNVAARLEALCDPGGICVSKTAFDQIESKLPLGYEYMGEQTVKNIPKPIGAYRVLMEPRVTAAKGVEEKKAVSFWRRKAVLSTGIIVILAIIAVLYWNFYSREPSIESDQAPVVSDSKEAPKTIAVLPFSDLSPEKDQEYFVDGLTEELLNSLTKISDLRVIARTSSFTFKGSDKTVQEIANILGADHILEGSVRKAGNALRITAQLIHAMDGIHLWSETYDRELKDIFAIQEDIATAVADELKLTLGISKSLKRLGGTDNLEAYELYLMAKGQQQFAADTSAINRALKLIDAAISLDPEFAGAWALKAGFHNLLSAISPVDQVDLELEAGQHATQKAIEIEPNLADGYASLGQYRIAKGDWIEAESAFRKALELTNEINISWSIGLPIGIYYLQVGYLKKANELFAELRRNNPLDQGTREFYLLSLGLLGDIQQAEEEYENCISLFGDPWNEGNWTIVMLRLNTDVRYHSKTFHSNPVFDVVKDYIESPEDGLEELHRVYADKDKLRYLADSAVFAAYFGAPVFAMDLVENSYKIDAGRTFLLWLPIMHEVRQLPRFKEYIKEIGLVDYWNQFGWPDLCRPVGDGDFECD